MTINQYHNILAAIFITGACICPKNRKAVMGVLIGSFIFHALKTTTAP